MNLKPNIMIFSVFESGKTHAENMEWHRHVISLLEKGDMPFLELQGKYNGVEELSILIEGFEHRERVEGLVNLFQQECYLESHSDRRTFLVFKDGTRKDIGTLTAVTKEEAERVGSYSYNPVARSYFVAVA